MAQETVEERLRKELTEKESWYKDDNEDNETTPVKFRRLVEGRRLPTASCRTGSRRGFQKGQKNKESKSVMFIPHTQNSELARELHEREQKIQDITGDKVKIV